MWLRGRWDGGVYPFGGPAAKSQATSQWMGEEAISFLIFFHFLLLSLPLFLLKLPPWKTPGPISLYLSLSLSPSSVCFHSLFSPTIIWLTGGLEP